MNNAQLKMHLKNTGIALYGERWQTSLSRDLKLCDPRRIRQWVADERPIPPGVLADLVNLLDERSKLIAERLVELKAASK